MSEPSQESKPKSVCHEAAKKSAKAKPTEPPKEVTKGAPLVEFPHFLRKVGPNQVKTMMHFMPSATIWGVTAFLGVVYMTEWKAVLQYLPYYNGKYVEEVDVEKPDVKNEPDEQNPENEEA